MRKPTLKQKKVAQILSENLGKPIGEAMREAGYSQSTSETPSNLTDSEAWQKILEDIDDSYLQTKLKEGLEAFKTITSPTEPDKIDPDFAVRHKYLDTALKLKNKYPPAKTELSGPNGSALQVQVIDHEINVSGYFSPSSTPNSSDIQRQDKIQDASVAQTSEKDNNSTD